MRHISSGFFSSAFLAQILYTLVKRSPLKCKFWDFPALGQNSPISSCHHSSVLWHMTPPYFFWLKHYTFGKGITSKCKFSELSLLALKFAKFFMSFSEPRVSFFYTLHHSSVSWDITLLCFKQKEPIKVQIFRRSTACMKINHIPHVIF